VLNRLIESSAGGVLTLVCSAAALPLQAGAVCAGVPQDGPTRQGRAAGQGAVTAAAALASLCCEIPADLPDKAEQQVKVRVNMRLRLPWSLVMPAALVTTDSCRRCSRAVILQCCKACVRLASVSPLRSCIVAKGCALLRLEYLRVRTIISHDLSSPGLPCRPCLLLMMTRR
jgi:hypothetical protein